MSLQPNNEVQLMLEVLKAYFHQNRLESTSAQYIDWAKFFEMQYLHALHPMLNAVFKENNMLVPEAYRKELNHIGIGQVVSDLRFKAEYAKLRALFKKNALPLLAFKGFVFTDYLYPESIRSGSDLDLLISKKKIEESLTVLEKEGYLAINPFYKEKITIEDIKNQLKDKFINEVAMYKDNMCLDVHWTLCYDFLPYQYPEDFIFELDEREQIFWTLLNHHGGKESWLRLKNLADLAAFIQKVGNDWNWPVIIEKTKSFGLHRQFINGLALLHTHLGMEIPSEIREVEPTIRHSCPGLVVKFWNKGRNWKGTFERMAYERIFIKSQDPGFRTSTYVRDFVKAYTRPNLIEERRFVTFPENFLFLNFLSKVFSYAINRTFKK